MNYKVVKK